MTFSSLALDSEMRRREFIASAVGTALASALPSAHAGRFGFGRGFGNAGGFPSRATFDYYISATGDDNNVGSLASPWSITALNTKGSTYTGKRIGIIGNTAASPTVIQYGTVGGTQTTLYSIYQGLPAGTGNEQGVLTITGGTSGSPTYIACCDASGNYSPRTALIDFSDPSTGNLPTNAGFGMGQSNSNIDGNVTIDGLRIKNCTYAAILFYSSTIAASGITVQNCEIYDLQNVVSNNNPGAIWFDLISGAIVKNCLIHDLTSNASGTATTMDLYAVRQFNTVGTVVSNCTFYGCTSISPKGHNQSVDVSYCYCGWGTFGSLYQGNSAYSPLTNDTINNYQAPTNDTISFHHNILLGPLHSLGATVTANEGTVLIYNNTFYKPSGIGGSNLGLGAFSDYNAPNTSGGTGTFEFYNNLVYADDGNYEHGQIQAAAFTKMGAPTGGTWSTLSKCDYNAYGSGMSFGDGVDPNWTFSGWQALSPGYDAHSITLSATPFSGTPTEPDYTTFAITGPATTAGQGGVACGAVDGSGPIGCNFTSTT